MIDPSASPFTPLPSSARELLTLARLNWVLAFDHVSTLSDSIADTLCRLSSGVGIAHRETGQPETLQLFLKRPILLTVTDRWTPPPDLAARALIVTLPPLADGARFPEQKLAPVIEQAFPRITGALYSAVSHALAHPPEYTASHTRHSAALAWAQAAAPTLNMLEAFHTSPPSNPFVDSVAAFLHRTPRWSGSATDLLPLLPLAQDPRALSAKLHKSVLPLSDAGIQVAFRRLPGGARLIDLFASQISQPLPPTPTAREPYPHPQNCGAACQAARRLPTGAPRGPRTRSIRARNPLLRL